MKLLICIGVVLCLLQPALTQLTCMEGHVETGGSTLTEAALPVLVGDPVILQTLQVGVCSAAMLETRCQRFDVTGFASGVSCEYQ